MVHNLTPAQIERLTCLAEEAAEVVQACTKVLRHGYSSLDPNDQSITICNRSQLTRELGDLRATLAIMIQAGDLRTKDYVQAAANKLVRVQEYLHEPENITLARECVEIHNGHG